MQRLRTVTLLDASAVAGHHAMPAVLLFGLFCTFFCFILFIYFCSKQSKLYIFNIIDLQLCL